MRFAKLLALAGFLAALATGPAPAATYALVVGINDYQYEEPLVGAVADARDIETALNEYGAANVVTLIDGAATHTAIKSGFDTLLGEARPGDLLIFSYSGHGSQAPANHLDEEEDGLDEFFVLSWFDTRNPNRNPSEYILDNEVRAWIKRADDKGVNTIFVADSCHSGGMDRATYLHTRLAPPVKIPMPEVTKDGQAGAAVVLDELKHAVFLSGAGESQPVFEIGINGQLRGALSYAFARSLEGYADLDRDGSVSVSELRQYVKSSITSRVEKLQAPEFLPRGKQDSDAVLLRAQSAPAHQAPVDTSAARLVLGTSGPEPILDGVAYATPYQYFWNAGSGDFRTPFGETAGFGITKDKLQTVVDKFRLLDLFKTGVDYGSVTIDMRPEASIYANGRIVSLSADAVPGRQLVLFDLVNDGTVQFLGTFPPEGAGTIELGSFQVQPPFGADHIIALAMAPDAAARATAVLTQGAGVTASDLLRDLLPALPTDLRTGILPFYTRERE